MLASFAICDPFCACCAATALFNHVCVLGLGIGCLIEYFQNDIEKLVHAFHPLFKVWVQLDYHNLKKLSDMSISIRRFISERSLIYFFFFSTLTSFRNITLYRLLSPKMLSVVHGISGALRISQEEMRKSVTQKTHPNQTQLNFSCAC